MPWRLTRSLTDSAPRWGEKMGGKPSKGTRRDRRLKENKRQWNPLAGKRIRRR